MALREEFWPWDGQPQEPTRPSDSAIKAGLQTLNNFATGNRSVFGAQVFSQVGSGHVRAGTLVGIGAANGGTGRLQASNLTVVAPPSSADFAVLLQFALNATGQTNKYAVYQKHSFSFDQTAIIYGYVANSFEFYTSGHGGSDPRTGSQIAVSDTRPHTLIYTYGGGVWSGWLDGVQAFVTARTFSLSSSSLDSSWLFDVDSPAATLNATVLTHATFARGLSDSLAREFSATPGKLYEPRRIWVPVSAGGGDVSVALSGQAATVSAGTLTPTQSLALSGQAATVSAGTLAPTRSLDLSGSAATVSAGALTPARSFSLTGSSVAASAGSFGLSSAVPLVGSGATFSAGNLTYSAGGNVTLALTGSVITTAAGSLALERTFALGGSQVTVSAGTLLLLRSIALAGSSATSAAGTITPSTSGNITLALTGAQVLAYAGIIVPSGGAPILTVFPPDYGFVTAGSRVVRVVRGTPLQRVATGSRRSSVRG